MAELAQWIEGARPRTLPNAIAPVLAGAGAAAALDTFSWWRSGLALLVALALIIGVNFANDYSDGVRGTDADRVGPLRLVGSRLVTPNRVLAAALGFFALAGVAGLVLVAATGYWWLLAIGAGCILGAWYYTGGTRPYGYAGFGEVAVFCFFGLIAVLGTQYVHAGTVSWLGVLTAVAVGSFSSAVLVANNLRDVPTDTEAGKRTLAVLLGEARTRVLYTCLIALPFALTAVGALSNPWLLLSLLSGVLAGKALRVVRSGAGGLALIPVLRDTGLAMLLWAAIAAAALAFG
ncbi:1,4-dihydroxy-2-naphthoate prenyltransferase [Tamaricihabitans halophyticus]|uniref:1,4-dihydroxy-2-naphthoate octaprenyltransferase n=1 Tax=Tamaricihabitans halophyticus TaxID=1262583 RepID=A0A4R2QVL4_9PSEU|nr:1,4-dihydroxy-2-naphthoate polyprenyltransferase [Tamaricihabitans halophyticus]TCP53129.1 1,4-dihydroxy-2-naphthoate prenyltransferase [Tamaricihabitans halophyticus]